MKALRIPLLTLCVRLIAATSLLILSCGEKRSEPLSTTMLFEVPRELSQQSHVLVRSDFNKDGIEEAIVIVRDSSLRSHRRDSVHLFLWSTSEKRFLQSCCFSLEDFESCKMFGFEKNAALDLVVYTNGGGSSTTATKGLELYRMKGSCFERVLSVENGNPEIEQIDSTSLIVKHDVYSTLFSRSEAVEYVDTVVVPSTTDPVQVRTIQTRYLENYAGVQQKVLDSLFQHSTRKQQLHRGSYEATIRRIMALRKLGKTSEAQTTAAQLLQRVPSLPSELKDALREAVQAPL